MTSISKVFVSATSPDLGSFRKAVVDVLVTKQAMPVSMDHQAPYHGSIASNLRERISGCDAVICLIGRVFGSEPKERDADAPRRSYTQLEYEIAIELGKPVFLFVATDSCSLDKSLEEIGESEELQRLQIEHLRRIAATDRIRLPFRSVEDIKSQVAQIQLDPESLRQGIAKRITVLLMAELLDGPSQRNRLGEEAWIRDVLQPWQALMQSTLARWSGTLQAEQPVEWLWHFSTADDAVNAALALRDAVQHATWKSEPPSLRFGVHLGQIVMFGGIDDRRAMQASHAVDVCRAVTNIGLPGQVLLTRAAFDNARQYIQHVPIASANQSAAACLLWSSHGRYVLKTLEEPIEICEVGVPNSSPMQAPPESVTARCADSIEEANVRGWRPGLGLEIPSRDGWFIERMLGEGGFGEVWLSRHARTKQARVFKFCFDVDRLRSFKREMTLFRLLRESLGERQDIAKLLDVKLDTPPFFLESEFVESGNLSDWVEQQGGLSNLSLADRLRIVAETAKAGSAAHSVGVIHKDLKPTNIFMKRGSDNVWHPVLADFGIGALADTSWLDRHKITNEGFTESLLFPNSSRTGTRLYSPPESLVGRGGTVQGDVYALGVILFQVLIGNFHQTVSTGWEEELAIALNELAANKSSNSEFAVERNQLLLSDVRDCVMGDPQKRLKTAAELAQRLEQLEPRASALSAKIRLERVAIRNKRLRALLSFTGIALLVVGGLSIFSVVQWQRAVENGNNLEIKTEEAKDSRDRANAASIDIQRIAQKNSQVVRLSVAEVMNTSLPSATHHVNTGSLLEAIRVLSSAYDLAYQFATAEEEIGRIVTKHVPQTPVNIPKKSALGRFSSELLDPIRLRRRQANLLMQYPFISATRELCTDVQVAQLSPDRNLLAVITPSNSGHTLTVFDLHKMLPTECIISIPLTLSNPKLTWSRTSQSIYVFFEPNADSLIPSSASAITKYSAISGAIEAKTQHNGMILTARETSDATSLIVVNQFNGSPEEFKQALQDYARSMKPKPPTPGLLSSIFGGSRKITSKVLSLDAKDLKERRGGMLDLDGIVASASIGDKTALICRTLPGGAYSIEACTLDAGLKLTTLIAKSNRDFAALSNDDRYAVTGGDAGLLQLWERSETETGGYVSRGFFGGDMAYSQPNTEILVEDEFVTIITSESSRNADKTVTMPDSGTVATGFKYAKATQTFSRTFSTADDGVISSLRSITSATRRNIAICLKHGEARIWDAYSQAPRTPLLPVPAGGLLAEFLNEKELVTVSADGQIRIWDLSRNTLGQSIDQGRISMLTPRSYVRDQPDGSDEKEFQNPYGNSFVVASRRADNTYVTQVFNDLDPKPILELHNKNSIDRVDYSSDGKYAVLFTGVVQRLVDGIEISPLLQIPGYGDAGDKIPRSSEVTIVDLLTGNVVAKPVVFDGPIVEARIDRNNKRLLVCSLNKNLSKGKLTEIEISTMSSMTRMGESTPPFATASISEDLETIAVLDPKGRPYLWNLKAGDATNPLTCLGVDLTQLYAPFAQCELSAFGPENQRYILLVAAGEVSSLLVLDVEQQTALRIPVQISDVPPKCLPLPNYPGFVVGTGNGELLFIDGPSRRSTFRHSLGQRVRSLAISPDGTAVAAITLYGQLSIRDLPDGNALMPPMALPIVSFLDLTDFSREIWKMTLKQDGQLMVGDGRNAMTADWLCPIRLLSGEREVSFEAQRSAVENQLPMRQMLQNENLKITETFLENIDWFDRFSLIQRKGSINPRATLSLFNGLNLTKIPNEKVATELAIAQLRLAGNSNSPEYCTGSIEYLLKDEFAMRLDAVQANQLISALSRLDAEKAIALIEKYRNSKHAIFNTLATKDTTDIQTARLHFCLGIGDDAQKLIQSALATPGVTFMEGYRPEMFVGFRIEEALIGIDRNAEFEKLLAGLSKHIKSPDPELAFVPKFIAYVIGTPLSVKPDIAWHVVNSNAKAMPFLQTATAIDQKKWDEALAASEKLEAIAESSYVFRTSVDPFPFTKAHALLMQAEVHLLSGNRPKAEDMLATATKSWEDFVKSARDQKIDVRTLWNYRISFEKLKARIEKGM